MMWQTERAALEAQLSGATAELAAAQAEAKAAREEATGLGSQLEAAEKAKVWPISLSSLSVMIASTPGLCAVCHTPALLAEAAESGAQGKAHWGSRQPGVAHARLHKQDMRLLIPTDPNFPCGGAGIDRGGPALAHRAARGRRGGSGRPVPSAAGRAV